jgi:hypothetical protein
VLARHHIRQRLATRKTDHCTIDADGTDTINEVNSEGKSITWHYPPVEGQAVPMVGRDNTTVLVKKINDHTNEQIWTSNGKTNKSKAVVSKDGKTTTFNMDGVDIDGKPFHETVAYKQ